ncbi:AzlD domain-containing protein [Aeromonas media]|uniref:AzlD domain-containing protein n=1 Tax=Aeromonas TaxID=642 RepID=UPI000FAB2AE9|nr:AzlD domain-containing protein [Aeromonas media]UCP16804.1 AzlD domain-containing protein [Aeromonas media]
MGWLMIGLLALITFFNRFAFFSRLTRYQPGAEMGAFLSFSAQSVLTAIWLPIVFSYKPGKGLDWDPDYLAATLLVTALTLLRLPTLVVVVVGMGCFFLLRWQGGLAALLPWLG